MHLDPNGYTNLAGDLAHAPIVEKYREKMRAKLAEVRDNDLNE